MIMKASSLSPAAGAKDTGGLRQRFRRADIDKSEAPGKCGKRSRRQTLEYVAFERCRIACRDFVEQAAERR